MKKSLWIVSILLIIVLCCSIFVGCNLVKKIHRYYPNLPLDLVFNSTSTDYIEVFKNDPTKDSQTTTKYAVSQKYETILGVECFVIYVEYYELISIANIPQTPVYRTYLHVTDENKTFKLVGTSWVEAGDEQFFDYQSIYSNIGDSMSYRYKMTNELSGRDMVDKEITNKTDTYIEYTCKDNEIFWISNDNYNVLLKYEFYYKDETVKTHSATFNVGDTKVPHLDGTTSDHVPYLNTLTADMFD